MQDDIWMAFEIEQIIVQPIKNPFICLFLVPSHLSKLLFYDKTFSRKIFNIAILLSVLIQCESFLYCS